MLNYFKILTCNVVPQDFRIEYKIYVIYLKDTPKFFEYIKV